jgi:NAD(P)-dependent dehydrogenase (short-subunit alcohol dehydrogenase family)
MKQFGATVVLLDIDADKGEQAARSLGIEFIQADVTDSVKMDSIAEKVKSAHGSIDIAFNNAGIAINVPSETQTDDEWLRIINVNLNAVYYCCRAFGNVMLEQGKGSIINTASMSGIVSNRPQPQSAYNASKAGVIQLTKSLGAEWAARGVRVNSISPGYVATEITKLGASIPEWYAKWIDCTPMGRWAEPHEIAGAVVFLASDASSYFTGSNLVLDGGYTAW